MDMSGEKEPNKVLDGGLDEFIENYLKYINKRDKD